MVGISAYILSYVGGVLCTTDRYLKDTGADKIKSFYSTVKFISFFADAETVQTKAKGQRRFTEIIQNTLYNFHCICSVLDTVHHNVRECSGFY